MRDLAIYPLLRRDESSAKNVATDSTDSNPASETPRDAPYVVASLDEVNRGFDLLAKPSSGGRRGIANACGLCRGLCDSSLRWISVIFEVGKRVALGAR